MQTAESKPDRIQDHPFQVKTIPLSHEKTSRITDKVDGLYHKRFNLGDLKSYTIASQYRDYILDPSV